MKKKEIRLGWQGGNSHYHDLYMIAPAIKRILSKYDNTKFVFFGDLGLKGLFKDVDESRIEWNNWVSNAAYPYKLATLNFDIGLCPIVDDKFNSCKSTLKYLEYSALKVPTIASNIPPYSLDITHNENGLLSSEDNWFNAMEELVLDENKRNELAESAYCNVLENHNSDTKAYLWLDAYKSLLKKDVKEVLRGK